MVAGVGSMKAEAATWVMSGVPIGERVSHAPDRGHRKATDSEAKVGASTASAATMTPRIFSVHGLRCAPREIGRAKANTLARGDRPRMGLGRGATLPRRAT